MAAPVPASPEHIPEPIVGIDLGTTNSVIAFCDERGPRALVDPTGATGSRAILPSVVRFGVRAEARRSERGATPGAAPRGAPGSTFVEAVGDEAREHAVEFPRRTIYSVKRLMGRALRDAAADVPYLAYEVVEGAHDTARIRVPAVGAPAPGGAGGEVAAVVSPQEVSAVILGALKERASRALGVDVRRAVVTVPAYFDDAQRQATRDAGRLAGLEVVRIVNEPTAAALAYGIGVRAAEPQTIAVFDLGGGTFDVSILRLTPAEEGDGAGAGADFFQVLSTAGDTHLGGDDVDQMIVRLVMEEATGGFDAAELPAETRQALRLFAESVKIRLSSEGSVNVRIDLGAGRVYERVLTRDEFEAMIRPWAGRTLDACRRALRDAKLAPKDVDRVVMVGGSTRIPLVRRMVGEFFGAEPYTALDPDLVVALGAAVQGSIVGGLDRSKLLLDVIPLSLGVETVGGAVAKLIVRNQSAPARAVERFTTSVDGQTSIKISIVQGEREMAADCRSLGEFHLRGVPPMPAGVPQLEVEFLVDANGVLNVSAVEKRSGKRASLQVVPSHGLSREEVERMEAESFAHARDDMRRHRVVDLVANARLDVKWTRDQLARVGPLLEPAYRESLERSANDLGALADRAAADWTSVDADAFHRAKEALDAASVRMHEVAIAESLRRDQEAAG